MASIKDGPPPPPNRLREWRKLRGMTMAEVAEKLEIKTASVARHETLGAQVTLGQLHQYAAIYRCSVVDLLATSASPAQGMGELIDLGHRLSPTQRLAIVSTWKAFADPPAAVQSAPASKRRART